MADKKRHQKNNVDELLIKEVQERPVLYDSRFPLEQRSKVVKQLLWKEISESLSGKLDPVSAELRWRYLRENYLKARNKLKIQEDIARQNGLPFKKKYTYRYHRVMQFLEDSINHQQTSTLKSIIKARDRIRRSHPIKTKVIIDPLFQITSKNKNVSKVNNINNTNNIEISNNTQDMEIENTAINVSNTALKRNYDKLFLECLRKPIETISPVDGFLIRLGDGLKRLPYRERSKLELEFLTRLNEVEEELLYSE